MARQRPASALPKLESVSHEPLRPRRKKLTETDILRISRKVQGEDGLNLATQMGNTRREAGAEPYKFGMDAIRSQIRGCVSDMYRLVRNGSSENARTDADLQFAMRALNPQDPHRETGTVLDDELRSRDILNCDLQEEIQKLEAEMKVDEAKHAISMATLKAENWELGEQLREFEKKNAMFTSALRSGAQSDMNHEGMTFNVGEGPEPQTNVLHEAIRSMHSVHESFVRIVPPQPFYQYGELKFDSNPVTAKVSRLRRPSSAKPMSSAQHSYPQRPGSAPLTQSGRTTVSVDQTKTEPSVRQVTDESALSGIAHGSSRAFSFKRSKSGASNQLIPGSSSSPGGGASPVGGAQAAKAAAQMSGWLATYSDVVECYVKANVLASMSSRTEYMKRRALVHKEVEKLLCGLPADASFHDAVDALDQKTRAGLLDEVATEFTALGIFARAVHSMRRISESSFDVDQCFELFTREVKELLAAEHVRLWLVDETNAQIWEWKQSERVPTKRSFWASESPIEEHSMFTRKRTFVKAGIAADVARTGIPINVPFPAVQCQSFSIEIDRLPGENARTVICEPIRHEGSIVAVTQCYNKMGDTEEASFTVLDEMVLRLLSEHVGGLWRKCETYDQTMSISEQTLNAMQLTTSFPCDSRDLYSLAQVHLMQTKELVRASHCVFYVYAPSNIPDCHKLWSLKPDGSGPRVEVEIGEGVAGWVAENREVLRLDDPANDDRFDPDVDAAFSGPDESGVPPDDFEARNLLAVPIDNLDGSLLGVCVMLNKASGPFHQTDTQLLQIRCQQVAHMVKTNTADLSHFFSEQTVHGVLDQCKLIVHADRALFFLVDKPKKRLQMVADSSQEQMPWEGGESAMERSLLVPLSDGLLGYVARVGIGICVPDAHLDPRFNAELDKTLEYRTTSLLCLPVVDPTNEALVLGVTLVTNKVGGSAFTAQDRAIANALSRQLGKLYRARAERTRPAATGSATLSSWQ